MTETKMRVITESGFKVIVPERQSLRPLLGPIKDAINSELAGRLRLFGVQRLTIVDFDTANKIGLSITREA